MKSCSCQRVTIQTNYESMSMQLANGAWMVDHLKYIHLKCFKKYFSIANHFIRQRYSKYNKNNKHVQTCQKTIFLFIYIDENF